MRERIRDWWRGKQECDPDYGPSGPFKRHFTSTIARWVVSSVAGTDWRWLITTAIAAVAAVASIIGMKD